MRRSSLRAKRHVGRAHQQTVRHPTQVKLQDEHVHSRGQLELEVAGRRQRLAIDPHRGRNPGWQLEWTCPALATSKRVAAKTTGAGPRFASVSACTSCFSKAPWTVA